MADANNTVAPSLKGLKLSTKKISSHLLRATVSVDHQTSNAFYKQAIELYKKHANLKGLESRTIPSKYIEEQYQDNINEDIKKFLLKHLVFDYLINESISQKIPLTNHPRLTNIEYAPLKGITYNFEISVATPVSLKEWRRFSFKAPKRKRYKDLDKQVALFLKKEHEQFKKCDPFTIETNDWVCFDAKMLNNKKHPIIPKHSNNLWMKINTSCITKPFQRLFLGKHSGDSFIVNTLPLDEDFEETISSKNPFFITIQSIIKGSFFSLEAFKNVFKLKNKDDVHNKLIEVFSYRNDISQRKSTIEEIFHLFFSKHRFEIPKHLVIRKQEQILHTFKKHPDYQVYKTQKDFGERLSMLAEKLLKEEILVDHIAYQDNIKVTLKDIRGYLSFFNTNRLKEFVYFKPPFEQIEETDFPLHESLIKQAVLREKTLNQIIHVLTRS
mgnify:CR=1 FL=1|jgi:FKBP-type peptidyl-prolyl cis-trans isomerase (trigger factor)